jgi:oxygen-independent coproporphyrinogen III oxidase
MPSIYIHIPFCRKACHYCNFHFSTSRFHMPQMVSSIITHINNYPAIPGVEINRQIETIYFGGGTPSLLSNEQLTEILKAVRQNYIVNANAEITLEANPDDITAEKLEGWKTLGINRLSIGVQSFSNDDLQWMNRAHNVQQAIDSIKLAGKYGFEHFSIDLIYGTPLLTNEQWQTNVQMAIDLGVNHLSCYALTVEEKTPLDYFIQKNKVPPLDADKQSLHFLLLMNWLQKAGFDQYEISNFCKPGHYSRHNSNYWSGNAYYGFGPAAHSFNGLNTRWWHIANNVLYMQGIQAGTPAYEAEILTPAQRINEKIMTALRTSTGLDKTLVNNKKIIDQKITAGLLTETETNYILTTEGKLFADGIAADLFE